MEPQTDCQLHHGVPWGIVLDSVWARLRPTERRSIAEACKEAHAVIRERLQTHVSLCVSRSLAAHFMTCGHDALKARYPFASNLKLAYDPDVMEEADGPGGNGEDRGRAASAVLAALGRHEGVRAARLDGWDSVSQHNVASLLGCLPRLESLELSNAFRLELEALLLPGAEGLTQLQASAEHILFGPGTLRAASALTRLRDLRLSGLQVNDQPADNELCAALGALTGLTRLELVTFSAATRTGMVALRGIHNETLRGRPLQRLPSVLPGLTGLRCLLLSDPHLETRTANAALAALAGLTGLEELTMPEARTREEGWLALQQLTSLQRVHLYSIELKGQAKARAPGSISWWRRLRLEDTCLPELAAVMPLPGLASFIATLYMRYGDGPVPPRDFAGMDRVLATLGAAEEVRLWLELDCDVWSGLSRTLGQLPGLAELVVRTRHPHPLTGADLAALLGPGGATRLAYLDVNNTALSDAELAPLGELPHLVKLCLGQAERPGQPGHTPGAVQWLAALLASRRRPALLVAPHLLDDEMEALEEWQQAEPTTRGAISIAEARPDLELPLPGDPAAAAGPFFRAREHSDAAGLAGERGGVSGGRYLGSGGGASSAGSYSLAEPDDPLVLLSNNVNDFFRRLDL